MRYSKPVSTIIAFVVAFLAIMLIVPEVSTIGKDWTLYGYTALVLIAANVAVLSAFVSFFVTQLLFVFVFRPSGSIRKVALKDATSFESWFYEDWTILGCDGNACVGRRLFGIEIALKGTL